MFISQCWRFQVQNRDTISKDRKGSCKSHPCLSSWSNSLYDYYTLVVFLRDGGNAIPLSSFTVPMLKMLYRVKLSTKPLLASIKLCSRSVFLTFSTFRMLVLILHHEPYSVSLFFTSFQHCLRITFIQVYREVPTFHISFGLNLYCVLNPNDDSPPTSSMEQKKKKSNLCGR